MFVLQTMASQSHFVANINPRLLAEMAIILISLSDSTVAICSVECG